MSARHDPHWIGIVALRAAGFVPVDAGPSKHPLRCGALCQVTHAVGVPANRVDSVAFYTWMMAAFVLYWGTASFSEADRLCWGV